MFPVWSQVQFKSEGPREGQAGVVIKTRPETPDEVVVKWDLDQAADAVKVSDLKLLGN